MKIPPLVIAVLLLGAGIAHVHAQSTGEVQAAPDPAKTAAVIDYLARHAIPVKTVEAGSGFEDLQPAAAFLKDARIVGLGEATHGSREFFQFKHRMLEFLVEKMGFDTFAIEASYVACLNINDYVMYGKGDPAAALASQKFWTWDTHEVADMIAWLREHNKNLPEARRVRFLGYDIQAYNQAFDVIGDYLKRLAPEHVPIAQEAMQPLHLDTKEEKQAFDSRSGDEKKAESTRLQALMDFFETNRARFVRQTSRVEFEKVLQHARVLYQYHEAYGRNGSVASRDRSMAENIRYLLNQSEPTTRMVVWAHNGHVADTENGQSMGHYLRQWYGPKYYVLGFDYSEGSFQAMGKVPGQSGMALQEFTVSAAPEGSGSWYLERARQKLGSVAYLIDFRSAPKSGPFAEWLAHPHAFHSSGSMFGNDWTVSQYMPASAAGQNYDGMFFIGKTTRAQPNPTGLRPAPAAK